MNWRRGFRRITFVVSIVSAASFAVLCGRLSYGMANKGLYYSRKSLTTMRNATCDADTIAVLISHWKSQPSPVSTERDTWKEWTGSELDQEPPWLNDSVDGESEEARKEKLAERIKRLDLLKEQGWRTAGGDRLPWTPEEVWSVQQMNQIKDLESRVQSLQGNTRSAAMKGALTGALLGFVSVWVLYAVAYLLVAWIARGFRDDLPKKGKQPIGSEPAGGD